MNHSGADSSQAKSGPRLLFTLNLHGLYKRGKQTLDVAFILKSEAGNGLLYICNNEQVMKESGAPAGSGADRRDYDDERKNKRTQ